jgi:hypothetical protein
MATHLNHVAIAAPRNGTTTHTVSPSSGTVVAGTAFTPTAGRLLVCVVEGAVTSSTPSGWTLPSGGSAINYTGLYVWHRTAAGSDSLTTTHNSSNYPVVFHFLEFAAGSTFGVAAAATSVAVAGGAGPSLSGLSGAPWVAAVLGQALALAASHSVTWHAGTELADTSEPASGTDGYIYGLTYAADYATATWSAVADSSHSTGTVERLVFSVAAVAGGGGPAQPLAGVVAATSGTAGSIAAAGSLVGATAGTTTVSGAPVAVHPVLGSVVATSTIAGAPVAVHPLTGVTAGTSTVAGDVNVQSGSQAYPLTGIVAATSAVIGSPASRTPLAGTVGAVSLTAGTFAPEGLSGTVAAISGTVGNITGQHPLAGSADATTTASGAIGAGGSLAGVVAATATTSAAIRAQRSLTGAVAAISGAVGRTTPFSYTIPRPNTGSTVRPDMGTVIRPREIEHA